MTFPNQPALKTRPVTVTLSRAHKINERISTKLGERRSAITTSGQAVSVQAFTGPEQAALIKSGAALALAVTPTYVALVEAQAALRTAVGRLNASAGISDVLATIEKNKKLITLCDAYLGLAPGANTFSVEALAARPVGEQVKDYGSVSVSGLTAADLQPYQASLEALERENFALQDQLADLNASKVTFELAEDLFDMLSLKAA